MDASEQITQHIKALTDWRGKLLARLRKLILATDPDIVEEWKWGTPVWSHKGNVVAVGAFQDHVKVNFFKGASLSDPHGLFNAGLEAKATRRRQDQRTCFERTRARCRGLQSGRWQKELIGARRLHVYADSNRTFHRRNLCAAG